MQVASPTAQQVAAPTDSTEAIAYAAPSPPDPKPPFDRYPELLLAIIGVVATALTYFAAEAKTERWLLYLCMFSMSTSIIGLVAFISQSRTFRSIFENSKAKDLRISDLQRNRDSLEGQQKDTSALLHRITEEFAAYRERRNQEEEAAIAFVHEAYAAIAEDFNALALTISKFEQSVFYYLNTLARPKIDLHEAAESRAQIETLYKETIREICETGVKVIARRKPISLGRVTFSTNIKVLVDRGDLRYFPLVRAGDGASLRDRKMRDEYIRENPLLLSEHRVYQAILNPSVEDDFYVCQDIAEEFARIAVDRSNNQFYSKPNRDDQKDYQAFVTVPIYGNFPDTIESLPSGHSFTKLRNRHVVGFLCIDSPKVGAFDAAYDLKIMQQLAAMLFDVFRAHESVHWVTSQMMLHNRNRGMAYVKVDIDAAKRP